MTKSSVKLILPSLTAALLLILLSACEKPYEGYALGDIRLNLSSQEVLDMYPARGMKADLKWMRTGDFGVIMVRPEDGSKDREESFTLLNNEVLQYTSTEPLDETRFAQVVEKLKARHGEPTVEPPHFARHNSYLRGLNAARERFEEIYFWGDKERSEVLSACYNKAERKMYFVLFDPQRYNRIDQMTREQNEMRQQMGGGQGMQSGESSSAEPPPKGRDETPPAEPPPGG